MHVRQYNLSLFCSFRSHINFFSFSSDIVQCFFLLLIYFCYPPTCLPGNVNVFYCTYSLHVVVSGFDLSTLNPRFIRIFESV